MCRSMPRPVEALPCGSRSMISTSSPTAASAVPRLIAVVVLPTPPFWLAIAITRGGCGVAMRLASGATSIAITSPELMSCELMGGDSIGGFAGSVAGSDMGVVPCETESRAILYLLPGLERFQTRDDDDVAAAPGAAGDETYVADIPIFSGLGQFSIYILSF